MERYTIEEDNFGGKDITTFDSREDWLEAIDRQAFRGFKGNFNIAIYDIEDKTKEIETKKVKIFGTQGRKDKLVYYDSIPEEWGEAILNQEVEYITYYEEDNKYICSSGNSYDSYDEMWEDEAPSQYLFML